MPTSWAWPRTCIANAMIIKHTFNPEESLDRRYVEKLADSFSMASSEAPIEYKEPPKGATPIATQHRSIYFDPNSSRHEPRFARHRR